MLTPLTCQNYHLFASAAQKDGGYHFLDHWNGDYFQPGQQNEVAAGIRLLDLQQLCEWLNRRDFGKWRYLIPDETELAAGGDGRLAITLPKDPFWVRSGDGFACGNLSPTRMAEALRLQMQMDILRELSPHMRPHIPPSRWEELRRTVRPAGGIPPPWGLDPKAEAELGMDVPPEPFAALGVVLAEPHGPEAASAAAAELGLDERALSGAQALIERILKTPGGPENMDPDAALSHASWLQQAVAELCRAYAYFPRYGNAADEFQTGLDRLQWLAGATWSAADTAFRCPRSHGVNWPAVKALRWCARVTTLTLAAEIGAFADPEAFSALGRRINGAWTSIPSEPEGLKGFFEDLTAAAISVYICLALTDIRSRKGLGWMGASAVLAREPAYPVSAGRRNEP